MVTRNVSTGYIILVLWFQFNFLNDEMNPLSPQIPTHLVGGIERCQYKNGRDGIALM